MAKISIPQFIHCKPALEWENSPDVVDGLRFANFNTADLSDIGYTLVGPGTIAFDLPDDFDPRGQQIAALMQQREKLQQEFAESVGRINRKISKLSAFEYTA